MRHVLKPLRELYGKTPARGFGPRQLKTVREKLLVADHCLKHINASIQRIGRGFRWAAGEGLIPSDVPQALAMVPGGRKGHTAAPKHIVRSADPKMVAATLPFLPPVEQAYGI